MNQSNDNDKILAAVNGNSLRRKWDEQSGAVRAAVGAGAVVIGIIFVLKVLPALVAAMGVGALLAILFVPYWLPTIVAFVRKHPSKGGILALNFFFGWTFIGWVVSLAWALSDNSGRATSQTVIVNTQVGGMPSVPQPHQIGDIVNGHLFDGVSWVPLPAPPAPPAWAAAPQPLSGKPAADSNEIL